MNRSYRHRKMTLSRLLVSAFLILYSVMTIYPLYNVVVMSLTSYKDSNLGGFSLFPAHISWGSYEYIFTDASIPRGFLVTTIVTAFGIVYNMFLSVTMGYALSKGKYPGRQFFLFLVIFTMIFTGGLIPFYLVVNGLGLMDTLASMILPVGINTFYMILLMNYFQGIPDSIEESAKMDGANDVTILFRIIVPLAKPILATVVLFYAVDRWNEYFNAILFIRSPENLPIQMILRNLLVNMETTISSSAGSMIAGSREPIYTQGMRMAIVVVTSLPILLIYPFLQKYFTKGIALGSIKA